MKIVLRDCEPFSAMHVNKQEAAIFTSHLNGAETFDFGGYQTPKSMMLTSLKFNLPKHSFAHGYLLSVDVDTFMAECNSGMHSTMEPILKAYVVGTVEIEYGGDLSGTKINAKKLKL